MKKFSLFFLIPILLSSCSTNKVRISSFIYADDDIFIEEMSKNLLSSFHYGDIDYHSYNATRSQLNQNNQIIKEIEDNNPDILLVNLVDRLASKSIVEKAKKHDVPIIFFNREPLSEDIAGENNIFYVGTDGSYEGKAQAQIFDSLVKSNANSYLASKYDKNKDGVIQLALVKGEQGHQDSEQRSNNCLLGLKELNYDYEILQSTFCDWTSETSFTEFEKIYLNNLDENGTSKIELVLSNNDAMALGVIDYLKTLPIYNKDIAIEDQFFPIIGVDATNVALKSIKNNELSGTVQNDYKAQVELIYKLACKILNIHYDSSLEDISLNKKIYYTKGTIITKDYLTK